MLRKEYNIKAYFKHYNTENKKLTLLFLDNEVEPFTKDFLTKYYSNAQNNPIKDNEFYIKHDIKKSVCYLDKKEQVMIYIQDLLDQIVSIVIYIKHYNFSDRMTGKKIIGWNIHLVKMQPFNYA